MVLSKQTIGLFVCISICTYKIINLLLEKENIKAIIKKVSIRILGIGIVGLLFLTYLILNNALKDFFDYAVFGVKTFSNKIEYINLIKSETNIIRFLSIFIPIFFIFCIINNILKKDKKLIIILFLSLSMFVVAFPISDNIHFLIGIIPAFIGIMYLINKILPKKEIKNKKILFFKFLFEYFSSVIVAFLALIEIYNFYKNYNSIEYYSKLNHFKNIPISKNYEENIIELEEYIQNSEKKVYILNFDSAIYMIPLDRYNKNYDMFLKGNLGKDGEQGQIKNILSEDALYMIVDDNSSRNWQNPEYVREYIKENLEKVDEKFNYYIYKNK